jgi:hypothetical protein
MKLVQGCDKPVTLKMIAWDQDQGHKREPKMKTVTIMMFLAVAFTLSPSRANGQTSLSYSVAPTGSSQQILSPDMLVKNVLLPEWRAKFVAREVKSWVKQGAAALGKMTVIEEEMQEKLSRITRQEKKSMAPLTQDNTCCSVEL